MNFNVHLLYFGIMLELILQALFKSIFKKKVIVLFKLNQLSIVHNIIELKHYGHIQNKYSGNNLLSISLMKLNLRLKIW